MTACAGRLGCLLTAGSCGIAIHIWRTNECAYRIDYEALATHDSDANENFINLMS